MHRDPVSGTSTGADVVVAFDPFGFMGPVEDLHWAQAPEPGAKLLAVIAVLALAALRATGRRT